MKKTLLFSLLFLLAFTIKSQTPVAYYPFNGNANDESGNGLNGTLVGNPQLTTDMFGNANSAYSFNGTGDHIDLGGSALLKPSNAVSLSLFASHDDWAGLYTWSALAGNAASGGYDLTIHGSVGALEASAKRNGAYGIAEYLTDKISNGWHHFAFTFDGRYLVLYIDGLPVDTNNAMSVYPIQYTYPDNHTLIGAEAGTTITEGDYFKGKIDEVRFYDAALSAAQVWKLYKDYMAVDEKTNNTYNIAISPKPANSFINIENLPAGICNYKIFDSFGKLIKTGTICKDKTKKISISELYNGFYFVNLHNQFFNITQKFIIQH
ncbi:MAG: T9SS type A sorting domain-containing protein [Bacteroidales bacterium]|nr:T9SS type A sorting domain-containing protein [Bacteroidales bacterium]